MEKIKPCPFCGSEAYAEPYEEEGLSSKFNCARAICTNYQCQATIEKISFKPIQENLKYVLEKWNQRSKPINKS